MGSQTVMNMERRRGGDRRERARLSRSELGRMASRLRALSVMHREREDHVDDELAGLRRDVDRLLEHAGLPPLPVEGS